MVKGNKCTHTHIHTPTHTHTHTHTHIYIYIHIHIYIYIYIYNKPVVSRLISMQYKAEGTAITVSTKEKATKKTFSRKLAILMDLTFYDSCDFYDSPRQERKKIIL